MLNCVGYNFLALDAYLLIEFTIQNVGLIFVYEISLKLGFKTSEITSDGKLELNFKRIVHEFKNFRFLKSLLTKVIYYKNHEYLPFKPKL